MPEIARRLLTRKWRWLVVGILLVALAVIVIAFVPLVPCPECSDVGFQIGAMAFFQLWGWTCPTCDNSQRATLLKSWTWSPSPTAK